MSFCFWEKDEVYRDHFAPGIYACSECGHELFSSKQKYDHHSPWPAFTETIHKNSVTKKAEMGSPRALKFVSNKEREEKKGSSNAAGTSKK